MTTRVHAANSPFQTNAEAIKGFGVSSALLLALLLLYAAVQPRLDIVRVRLATIIHPVETFSVRITLPPVHFQQTQGGAGSADGATARADVASTQPPQTLSMIIPVPTDDPSLGRDLFDPDHLGLTNGSGPGANGVVESRFGPIGGSGVDGSVLPDDQIFEFVEIDPQIDLEALRDAIVYPELARRNGVEGTVIVRALINASGAVSRVEVYHSDNALLNQAAMSGVQHASFTSGKQNGHAVSCWIYVPVNFKLSSR